MRKDFRSRWIRSCVVVVGGLAAWVLLGVTAAVAETRIWIPPNGVWDVPANWSGNAVPTPADTARVDLGTASIPAGVSGSADLFYLGYFDAGAATLDLAGGSLQAGSSLLGGEANDQATANVTAGTWTSTNSLVAGVGGKATLNVSGTGVVRAPSIVLGVSGNGEGIVNLDVGGTIETGGIAKGTLLGAGTGKIFFRGGTLRATADNDDFLRGFDPGDLVIPFDTASPGLTIDTGEFDVTIASAFTVQTLYTLIKSGSGRLAVAGNLVGSSGAHNLIVESGTFEVTTGGVAAAQEVRILSQVADAAGHAIVSGGTLHGGWGITMEPGTTLDIMGGTVGLFELPIPTAHPLDGTINLSGGRFEVGSVGFPIGGTGTLNITGGELKTWDDNQDFATYFNVRTILSSGTISTPAAPMNLAITGGTITSGSIVDGGDGLDAETSEVHYYAGNWAPVGGKIVIADGTLVLHADPNVPIDLSITRDYDYDEPRQWLVIDGFNYTRPNEPGETFTIVESGFEVRSGQVDFPYPLHVGYASEADAVYGTGGGAISVTGGVLNTNNILVGSMVNSLTTDQPGAMSHAHISGGVWTNTGTFRMGRWTPARAQLHVEGGRLETHGADLGLRYLQNESGPHYSPNTPQVDAFVSGGQWINHGDLNLGVFANSFGYLTISGDGHLHNDGTIVLGFLESGLFWNINHVFYLFRKSSLRLNGGVLETRRILGTAPNFGPDFPDPVHHIAFDGGRLRALASEPNFVQSDQHPVVIESGGAFIDSGGFDVGINARIIGDGALVKEGDGMMTLLQPTNYSGSMFTGDVVVRDGTLRLNYASLHDAAGMLLMEGALVDLNFTGADTIGSLVLPGTMQATGTWGSLESSAANKSPYFTGLGLLEVSSLLALPTLPGDYNNNGVHDAADYIVWRKTNGQLGAALAADGNRDGQVDDADKDVWRSDFGQTVCGSVSGANTEVPEPAAMLMLIVGPILTATRRRAATFQT